MVRPDPKPELRAAIAEDLRVVAEMIEVARWHLDHDQDGDLFRDRYTFPLRKMAELLTASYHRARTLQAEATGEATA